MDITKENIDALNGTITVKIQEVDYKDRVENILGDYRKRAKIDGFRPGKVPMGIIKKMYFKPILAEELNKIVIDSVYGHIRDNDIQILGEPLPSKDHQTNYDFDKDTEFEFKFDVGYTPSIDVDVNNKTKIVYYNIKTDKDAIKKATESISQQHGDYQLAEKSEEESAVKAKLVQLDDAGNELDGGIQVDDTLVSIKVVKDDKIKKSLIGKKLNDTVDFDLKKAYPNDTEIAGLLKIEKEEAEKTEGNFRLTFTEIKNFVAAEVNEELYKKAFGEDVKTKEEFEAKIQEQIGLSYANEADYRFKVDAKNYFLSKLKFDVPAEFLKRWLVTANKDKFTEDDIDKDFEKFESDLKWQIIKNKIAKNNEITTSPEDEVEVAKRMITMQYQQYGLNSVPDNILNDSATKLLENEQERGRVIEMAMEDKVFSYIKENAKLEDKDISVEKFNKLYE